MIEIIRVTFDGTVSYIENGEQCKMSKETARRMLCNLKPSDYLFIENYEAEMAKCRIIINAKEVKSD